MTSPEFASNLNFKASLAGEDALSSSSQTRPKTVPDIIPNQNRRLTWDSKHPEKKDGNISEEDIVRNQALEETMEHLVPPPKRRIGEDTVVVKHKPITEVTEQKLNTFTTDI